LLNRQIEGRTVAGLDGLIAQAESHLDELNNRRDNRLRDLEMERHCTVGDLTHICEMSQVAPGSMLTMCQLPPR
jgi:hypothetical protein